MDPRSGIDPNKTRKTSDLHLHLNGSFSNRFLSQTADDNLCLRVYGQLQRAQAEYRRLILSSQFDEAVKLVWKQFELIHIIVARVEDIRKGTIDVIVNSKAGYLEIRTTPKAMYDGDWHDYVNAFVKGLEQGNAQFAGVRTAKGLLSIDRSIHGPESAKCIIDEVMRRDLLVGVDISGNPLAPRTLTGDGLVETIRYALSQNIGIAIHVGEVDSAVERQDVDNILKLLSEWKEQQAISDKNPLHGKVRLGHGIHLTDAQQSQIRALQLPIEVCPSCHEQLRWWDRKAMHPVKRIYQFWSDPVVSGTDDQSIFGGNAKVENRDVLRLFGYPEGQKRAPAREHQSQFRFGKGV